MIECFGINFDPKDDEQVFQIIMGAQTLNANQRFWLFHCICGLLTANAELFLEKAGNYKNKNSRAWADALVNKHSMLSEVLSATHFMLNVDSDQYQNRSASELNNLSAEALDIQARYFLANNRFEDALLCYKLIDRMNGPDPLTSSKQAAIYFAAGQYEQADAKLSNAQKMILKINPEALLEFEKSNKDLEKAMHSDSFDTEFNQNYWGDKLKARSTWEIYFHRFKANGRYANIGNEINSTLSDAIEETFKDDPGISTVVNYGTFCAYPDYQWALARPNCRFVCYDRESFAIDLNRSVFKVDNLEFSDGEFDDCLSQSVQGENAHPAMLCHVRAFTEMTPAKIESIYAQSANQGIKWIIGVEQFGPNIVKGNYFKSGQKNSLSSMITTGTVSHNYEYLLDQAGYDVVEMIDRPILGYHQLDLPFPILAVLSGINFRTYRARLRVN